MRHLAIQQFAGRDGKFFLLDNDIGVSRAIKATGRYQPTILKQCLRELRKGNTVLDIGSNIGSFTIPFAKIVGDKGTVYAFEPQRIIFQILCGNIILNKLPNVHAHHVGLSDSNKIASMTSKTGNTYTYFDKMPFTHCTISDTVGEKVELKTLDSFHLPVVTFMKIDVEQHEIYCLRGAIETINRCRPSIVIELYRHTKEQKQLAQQVDEFMKEARYRAEPIVRPNGQIRDVLFRPVEKCT